MALINNGANDIWVGRGGVGGKSWRVGVPLWAPVPLRGDLEKSRGKSWDETSL